MSAIVYNCTATILDIEGKALFTKNVFAFRQLLTALDRVNNDILPSKENQKVVNDFRKDQKITKLLSNTILLQYLNGSINSVQVSVELI